MNTTKFLGLLLGLMGCVFIGIHSQAAESQWVIPVLKDGTLQIQDSDRPERRNRIDVVVLKFLPKTTFSTLREALEQEASEVGVVKILLEIGGRRAPYTLPCASEEESGPWYRLATLLMGKKPTSDIQTDPSLPNDIQIAVHVTKSGFKSDGTTGLKALRGKLELLKSKYKVIGIQILADPEVEMEPLMDFFLMANSIQLESYFICR